MRFRLSDAVVAVELFVNRIARQDRGEGVISTAIAVLIIALLGAAMWAAFKTIFDGATSNVGNAVSSIGG